MSIEEYSLEAFIGLEDTEESLIQNDIYPNEQAHKEYTKEKLEEVLEKLTQKELEIVTLYFGLDGRERKNEAEIGKMYGMSSERVRQCVAKAIRRMHPRCRRSKKLRDYLDD